MVPRPFNGGPDKLDLTQILISEIKLQFYLFLPIPHSLVLPQQMIPKDIHPPPQPLAFVCFSVFVFFFSFFQHTPTSNRRYHTREIDVKPDKTKSVKNQLPTYPSPVSETIGRKRTS